jgi:hypothetical protein
MKNGQKSVFHPRKTHILAQLDITLLYIIFFEVLKKHRVSAQNKGVSLRFYRQMSVHSKNSLKIHISSP